MAVNLTIKTAGGEYPVEVLSDGRFSCDYDGVGYTDDTYAKLADKVKDLAKRAVAMAIPGTLRAVENSYSLKSGKLKFINITVTGVHSGNGNIMYRHDDSPKALHQTDRWGGDLLRRLTLDEQKHMQALKDAAEQAQKAYDAYVAKLKLPREQPELLEVWNALKSKQTTPAPKTKGKTGK